MVGRKSEKQDVFSGVSEDLSHIGIDNHLIALKDPLSFGAVQFKMLRTKLLFPASGKPVQAIMVTSAVPGEGKSFVSANLAVSIAQSINEHVLLIDCDLRHSSIHKYFGFVDVPGLSDYLSKGTPLPDLFLKTKVNKLTVLPGGFAAPNPSELLSSERMRKLLEELKARYSDRYIIIDSPPPKLTAESEAVARLVDGIILVVKHESTPRDLVTEVADIMGKDKIIGVIVNWFDMRSLGCSGYGKYGDYARYYHK
jgi:exopolysaccharide/PEP-CTERM locus tyrosine autokinase